MLRAAALVVVLGGVPTLTACNRADTPTTPTPSPTSPVHYAVVGASDTIGFGGSVLCVPFDPDCPTGTGYVYVVKRRFQADGVTVQLSNRGLPGAVLSSAILALARDIGRTDIPGTFLDQVVPFIPSAATHISIFAGGNDANVISQNVLAGRGAADVRAFVDEQVRQFGTDLIDLVARLRARAPNARIVALNLPNLAAAPYVNSYTSVQKSVLQRIAVGLTDRINALTAQNVIVVDLLCESRVYTASSFGSDGFHPSDQGYALMAELLYPALRTGTTPTPSASCPARTLLPVF
jgi:lysophospholipase L1-like esterase